MFKCSTLRELNYKGMLIGRDLDNKGQRDLEMVTKVLDNTYTNPSIQLCTQLEYIKENYDPLFQGSRIGTAFEDLFIDALVNFQNTEGNYIPVRSLHTNKTCNAVLDLARPYCVDIDMLLNEEVAFFLKTSLRERWKQWDRDALIVEYLYGVNMRKVMLFFRENPSQTAAQSIALASKVKSQFKAQAEVLSVYDEAGMYELFDSLTEGSQKENINGVLYSG
jgi:hypothetical protein